MRLQIDIENGASVKQGSGPIATATGWRQTRRLDRAGTFAFSMPAQDPQRSLAAAKRVTRCYGLDAGETPLEIGSGIIDSRTLRVGPNGATAEIAGDDLLRELTYYTVADLALRNVDNRVPDYILHNDDPLGANTFTAKTIPFTVSLTVDDYLYIGDAAPFYAVEFVRDTTVNLVEATLTAEYWDGVLSAWVAVDIEDGTVDLACTLRKGGEILYERMLTWGLTTIATVSAYWLRLKPSKTLTAAIDFHSLTIKTEYETATALADIIACAPGWALDTVNGYGTTGATVYARFAGESVLAAFVMVAKAIGEHFILSPGERKVRWLRNVLADSGLRAVAHVDPIAAETNDAIVLLADLQQTADSYDLITRIYPYGAGNGYNRLTLRAADWTPPAGGYTIDTAQNYIQSTAGYGYYGLITRAVAFNEIGPQVNTYADEQMAANQLAIAAHAQLSRCAEVQEAYTCRVLKAPGILLPGQTIRVTYHEWRDGVHVIDIDKVLYILESTDEVDGDGIRTTGLTLSTVDRWPIGDDDWSVEGLEDGKIIAAYAQATAAYSVSGPYVERCDSTNVAEFTCRIGREVLDVQRATLRFRTRPLTSSVKSAVAAGGGGIYKSTEAGGAIEKSSEAGGSVNQSTVVDETPHHHPVYINDGTTDNPVMVSTGVFPQFWADGVETTVMTGAQQEDELSHSHGMVIEAHTHEIKVDAHTHLIDVAAHTHEVTMTYGIYTDTAYPTGLRVLIDGADVTDDIGGPWATASEAVEVEAEIGAYLRAAPGGLRQRHRIAITATGGQGEVECEVAAFVVTQAIQIV